MHTKSSGAPATEEWVTIPKIKNSFKSLPRVVGTAFASEEATENVKDLAMFVEV